MDEKLSFDIRESARASRISFRMKDGRLTATVPIDCTQKQIDKAYAELEPRLREMVERYGKQHKSRFIGPDFRIETDCFRMALRQGLVQHPRAISSIGALDIVYPAGTDFQNEEFQQWLLHVTEEALRHQAKLQLPNRLMELASAYGLQVLEVRIHNTKGRWGSRSSKGIINLSFYLLLLPRHLQDYVMMHELCHITYMDHSPRFWALLDRYCQGQNKKYRSEMKRYDTSIFSVVNK